jgi:MFS transporter, MHS family, shikimate and dehydroshikimate transport protein
VTFAVVAGIALCQGIVFALHANFMPELFGTNVRYGGISLGFQLGAAIGGGLTPVIAAAIVARSGSATRPVSFMLVALGLVIFFAILSTRESQANALMKKTERSSRANVHATALLETAPPLGSPR